MSNYKNISGLQVQVNTAHKMGEKTCPIELNSERDQRKIMQNKYKFKEDKIFVGNETSVLKLYTHSPKTRRMEIKTVF